MNLLYLLKRTGVLMLLVCSALGISAQTGQLSGRVLDETGQPLPGASVVVKETNGGTSTDGNGYYRLTGLSQGNYTVRVSFIGYQPLDQTVSLTAGGVSLNFKLVPDAKYLNEVVVIGYGSVEKKNLTGAVTTVNAKDFQKGAITSPDQLLAGKVAGLSITPNGGNPGSGSTIRIRGGASLNASNNPLIVIDGNPLSGQTQTASSNPLTLINPNDIESFVVLKDANATAIYGSRASNGVILITTKKGGGAVPVINFSSNNSLATIARKADVLSADEVRTYINANGSAAQKALLGTANTDWQNVIFDNAFSTDNNLSLAGTFQKVPYRISGGYLDQKGMLRGDRLKRATAGISLSPKLFNDHLKIELNLKGSLSDTKFANTSAIGNAIVFDPTQAIYADNAYGGYFEWLTGKNPNNSAPKNPLALLELNDNQGKASRSFGNVQMDYAVHFLKELHVNLNLGYDVSSGSGRTYVPAYAASNSATGGLYQPYMGTQDNRFAEAYLNYNKTVKSINSNFNVTAGYGFYDNAYTNFNLTSYNALGAVISTPARPFVVERNKLLSYYGRFIYTLADRYILSGTIRADGSSKFSPEGRWGYFPSAAFTWKLKEEAFLKDSKVLSDLKLRLSYGQTGNKDGIGNYAYLPTYYPSANEGQYETGNGFSPVYTPMAYDKTLRWESTTTSNVGIDYGFAGGRIYGSIDAYYKKTKDLLATVEIPVGTNFSNQLLTNVGNMENKGIEASLNIAVFKGERFNWDLGFNVAYNKNKVTNLTLNNNPAYRQVARAITGGTGNNIEYHTAGLEPYAFLVYKQVYDAQGKPIEGTYVDLNGDGKVTPEDMYFYKSPAPKYVLGFSTAVNYKKWTLSTVLRSNIGNYVYDNVSSNFGVGRSILNTAGTVNNVLRDFFNTGFAASQFSSDYYVKNASFLKMDNLGLVYNVGRLSKNGTTTLSLSANCQNVFVLTKYKGIDPEVSTGIDYMLYPRPRTYTLGANFGF
ncbi:SusC/RagA family TonB-linked outer membrane protein [Pedobacter nutrimenti]|uniref:Iron complex outermembrane receptor protein n=1 Tax=Pedobacter nutrimenti TaxID=1241337 RepID=A0A318UE99_9SPHI|nr:SusC/RagA family TonB-linked outer membrane protein [Pedobacter nutrimenti]PYF74724.1 iron complex outermembrane receptor protein [Pedobacter nutrimenti]